MSQDTPIVSILMGSKSDLPIMTKAADVFKENDIPFELKVMSAHRLPNQVAEYASNAKSKGIKVLIGGAGMAAHLCGALAAHSTLPVIGVPLTSQQGLGGVDALYSTVQMPKGVPVATVAIDNAANAAFLAMQIIGLADPAIAQKYEDYRKAQQEKLLADS
jgi:5-(carboxyamino)imidazole ribonucleotide mutase